MLTTSDHMLPAPPCRCCLKPVFSYWQANCYKPGGKVYVHCEQPDCPLYYATRELCDWLTMDLDQWKGVQHPQWRAPQLHAEVA